MQLSYKTTGLVNCSGEGQQIVEGVGLGVGNGKMGKPESGHRNWPVTLGRNNSGSFAIFTAIRRASSWVSSFAADRGPGSSSRAKLYAGRV
jgi:hypothetical protein